MTPDQIFAEFDGKGVDVDGAYGNQCVDWAIQFASSLGVPLTGGGNAIDYAGRNIPGYSWVVNSPSAVPQKGDIVVWGKAIGTYGHIAVFAEGDANSFRSYDQNWPLSVDANGNGTGVVHLQSHNYNGVLGWQHPIVGPTQGGTVDDINTILHGPRGADGLDFFDHWKTMSYDLGVQVDNLNRQVADRNAQVADLTKQVADAQAQIATLTTQVTDLHTQITKLQGHPPHTAPTPKPSKPWWWPF